MNKYSKIKLVNNHHSKKSRSIDFSDLTTFPQIITKPKTQEPKVDKTHKSPPNLEQEQDQENPEQNIQEPKINGDEGVFNLKLSRNSSVSSNTSSRRFRFEKQTNPSSTSTTTLEDAVKRAFSVRRSSSVSERYCRIHDQCVSLSSPLDEDEEEEEFGEGYNNVRVKSTRSMGKKKKKQSKILKACKRFFGL